MESEIKHLREKAGRLEEASAYYMALLECASQVEKLEVANKELEKRTKGLEKLKKCNEQLNHRATAAQSQEILSTKVYLHSLIKSEQRIIAIVRSPCGNPAVYFPCTAPYDCVLPCFQCCCPVLVGTHDSK